MRRGGRALLGPVMAVLGLAAGCTTPAGPGAILPSNASSGPPVRVHGLFAVTSKTLGPIVVDGQGFALYRSARDSSNPPRSACLAACLVTWPPAPAWDDLRVVGIDRQLVGRLTRPDGTVQLTLAGWPLYGNAGDRMPGDATAEGQGGSWFVIAPSGARAG